MEDISDGNRRDAAQRCQREALRHELPHQPAATGTERQSQHHLGSPRRAAREQQVREVGAGDEQQDADGGHESRQRRRELPALCRGAATAGPNLQTLIEELLPAIARRGRAIERLQVGLQYAIGLRLGLSGRDAWRQPREDMEPHRLVWWRLAQPVVAGNHARLQTQRYPGIRLLAVGFADEAGRRDADDRQRRLSNRQGLAEHVRASAEAPLPIGMADHHFAGIGAIDIGGKDPAKRGPAAQHLEEGAGHQARAYRFLSAAANPRLQRRQAAL